MGYKRDTCNTDLNRSNLFCQLNSFCSILDGIMSPFNVKGLTMILKKDPFLYGRVLVMSDIAKQEFIKDFVKSIEARIEIINLLSDDDDDSETEFWNS